MKFSSKAHYGLTAMLYLAAKYGESAVPVSHISKEEDISPAYLEQILNTLKKEGLVRSVRGPRGGYVLTRKPNELKVGQIIQVLDRFTSGTDDSSGKSSDGKNSIVKTASALFWNKVDHAFKNAFSGISLQDLIQSADKNSPLPALAFNI